MHLSPIMNLIGAVLIVTAIVLHIVCLATPYWAGADSDQMKAKLEDLMKSKISEEMGGNMGSQMEGLSQQIQAAGMLASADISYGLWKMCIHSAVSGLSIDFCAKWASKTEADDVTGMIKGFKTPGWIRGVQAMAILGLLAAVTAAVLAGVHLFVPSRGDRLRLLPVFICVAAFVAGGLVLCGDIILAAKYDKILESMAEEGKEKPPQTIMDIIESLFFLSWGFALDVVAAALLLLSGLFYIVGGRAAQAGGLV